VNIAPARGWPDGVMPTPARGLRVQAFARACEDDPLRLGIFYQKEKPVFEEQLAAYADDKRPLFERRVDLDKLAATMRGMG
jgi:2-oxoglutarate ferredoxin oxidoreductase subunit beta